MGILYDGAHKDKYIQGFSDSDYAGDLDTRRSTTEYIFILANSAISGGSLKQKTVSLSTTEAEYIAACEATKEAVWLRHLLRESDCRYDKPVTINIDNQSAIKLVRNPEFQKD